MMAVADTGEVAYLTFRASTRHWRKDRLLVSQPENAIAALLIAEDVGSEDAAFSVGDGVDPPIRTNASKSCVLIGEQIGVPVEFLSDCFAYVVDRKLCGVLIAKWNTNKTPPPVTF